LAEEAGITGSAVNTRHSLLYQDIQVHLATGTNRAHKSLRFFLLTDNKINESISKRPIYIVVGDLFIKRGIPLRGLTPPNVCRLSQARALISYVICGGFVVFGKVSKDER